MTARTLHALAQDGADFETFWGKLHLTFGFCFVLALGAVQLARAEWKRWGRA